MCWVVLSAVSRLHQLSCVDSSVSGVYWISRYGGSECRRVCCSNVFVFVSGGKKRDEQWGPKQYRKGRDFGQYQCGSSAVVRDVCLYLLFGWCSVSSGVSLRLVWTVGLCRCKLWPASMCLKVGERGGRGRRGEGPSVAQCPKLPSLYKCLHWLLCTNAEMRNVSVLHRRVGWEVSCSLSLCISGTLCVTVAAEW